MEPAGDRQQDTTRRARARGKGRDMPRGDRLYWVKESGVRVRNGPGLQHPILSCLARGQVVTATTDMILFGDGYHWLPVRHGDHTAYIARELLADRYVRPDLGSAVPVAPELATAVQDTPLAAHTRALMAIALCESGARTARDNGGELVYRFESRQWDRLYRNALGDPPDTWTWEKCYVTSWGVGQIMGWAHATFGCADALAFRDWLQADPAHEYEALVRFCLAKPGVATAIQTESWEQLWRLYNGGHSQWLSHFQSALQRVKEVDVTPTGSVPEAARTFSVAPGPFPEPVPGSPLQEALPSRSASGLSRQAAIAVSPVLKGLRYEGSRLLRRALLLVSLAVTLWQTDVITPDRIVALLADAMVQLVETRTEPVAVRLDRGLDTLEVRLQNLEQAAGRPVPESSLPQPVITPDPDSQASAGDVAPLASAQEASTPTPPASRCTPRQTVMDAWYHVRSRPGRDADVVALLGPGTPVCVQKAQVGWSRLQEPAGWIVDQALVPLPVAG